MNPNLESPSSVHLARYQKQRALSIARLEAALRNWESRALPPSRHPTDHFVSTRDGTISFWVAGVAGRGGFWQKESAFPAMQAKAVRQVEVLKAKLVAARIA